MSFFSALPTIIDFVSVAAAFAESCWTTSQSPVVEQQPQSNTVAIVIPTPHPASIPLNKESPIDRLPVEVLVNILLFAGPEASMAFRTTARKYIHCARSNSVESDSQRNFCPVSKETSFQGTGSCC